MSNIDQCLVYHVSPCLFSGWSSDTGQNVTSVGCVGSRCYWLVLKKSYTRDAGAECDALMGAHLATVPDERTNLFLLGRITQWGVAPYLGALAIKMPWTWVDQSKYSGKCGELGWTSLSIAVSVVNLGGPV